ncbi:MAG: hypothetical protein U0796_23950 [Gemmatales bacterium]
MLQVMQLVGAFIILAAFFLSQRRRMDPHGVPYLVLNTIGAGILAILAAIEYQWGFLLLEGVWSLVSIGGLCRLWIKPSTPTTSM